MKNENITSSIEEITPAIAQQWIYECKDDGNRKLSQTVVNSYADTMKSGKWLVNGEAITFDNKGKLLNGHHRLQAIVNSGVTIRTFVVRGVNHDAFTTFDCGRNRTFGQLICMQGTANGNNVAAIVKAYLVFKNGFTVQGTTSGISNKTIHETNKSMMDYYKRNEKFFKEVTNRAMSICGKARVLNNSFVGGSIAYLVSDCGYNEEMVYDFFSQLCSAETAKNSTINVLRRHLIENRESRKDRRVTQNDQILVVKCWNAFVTGKNVKTFKWIPSTEGFPKYLKNNEIK